jgi:hypothetical protein
MSAFRCTAAVFCAVFLRAHAFVQLGDACGAPLSEWGPQGTTCTWLSSASPQLQCCCEGSSPVSGGAWIACLPAAWIIGLQKAGTTALHAALAEHPAVLEGSAKELQLELDDLLAPPLEPPSSLERIREDAQRRVSAAHGILAALTSPAMPQDATPRELRAWAERSLVLNSDPRLAGHAHLVASLVPNARLLLLLREPAERAISHFLMRWRAAGVGANQQQREQEREQQRRQQQPQGSTGGEGGGGGVVAEALPKAHRFSPVDLFLPPQQQHADADGGGGREADSEGADSGGGGGGSTSLLPPPTAADFLAYFEAMIGRAKSCAVCEAPGAAAAEAAALAGPEAAAPAAAPGALPVLVTGSGSSSSSSTGATGLAPSTTAPPAASATTDALLAAALLPSGGTLLPAARPLVLPCSHAAFSGPGAAPARAVWPIAAYADAHCNAGGAWGVSAGSTDLLVPWFGLTAVLEARTLTGEEGGLPFSASPVATAPRLRVLWLEHLQADPAKELAAVTSFLGLTPLPQPPASASDLARAVAHSPLTGPLLHSAWRRRPDDDAALPPLFRARLQAFFEPFERLRREYFARAGLPELA